MRGLGVVERAVRSAEREREAAVFAFERLAESPPRRGEAALVRAVYELLGVSGRDIGVSWILPPPFGSIARLSVPAEGLSLVALLERSPLDVVVPRLWVDDWPGARPVNQLSDLAPLAERWAA
jgi:hypothetical protein